MRARSRRRRPWPRIFRQGSRLFHHERLSAPANTKVPNNTGEDARRKRVFVCSMADLYGRWVPRRVDRGSASGVRTTRNRDYLMLTKFPLATSSSDRCLRPRGWVPAWMSRSGSRIAEQAFREIKGVPVKWLSLEPLKANLRFTDLRCSIGSSSVAKLRPGSRMALHQLSHRLRVGGTHCGPGARLAARSIRNRTC